MSIVPLIKLTVFGFAKDKDAILAGLQELGCVHVEPLQAGQGGRGTSAPAKEAYEALQFLLSCPNRRRQERRVTGFDARKIQREALALKAKMQDLDSQLDRIGARIVDLRPWGEFALSPLDEMQGLRLWFYVVPLTLMRAVEALPYPWRAVHRDQTNAYVAVVSREEPQGMPVLRTHAGTLSLSELEQKQASLENAMADLQSTRESLTRWCDLFMQAMWELEDRAAVEEMGCRTHDAEGLFALRGWAARADEDKLREFAVARRTAVFFEEPLPGEEPPTMLRNREPFAAGEDLVAFYMTPGYRLWDPSAIVFVSFVVFFAMIFSDAGYGLIMAAIVLWKWNSFGGSPSGKRFRTLCVALSAATIVWGVLAGGYFGIHLRPDSFLAQLKLVEIEDDRVMMPLVILIGVAHVLLANACDVWRRRWSLSMLSPAGWIAMISGGASFYVSTLAPAIARPLQLLAYALLGIGVACIVLFSEHEGSLVKRLLGGLHGLTRISSAFGDILSYMRIFALALAGVSLAVTFNNLGAQISRALPGIGIAIAALVLVFGHVLNFGLCIMSGFVHGLRLNFIEFFNWSMYEEGKPFKPFAKKGGVVWNR
ncbi:MAG TPA: hypothetical protein P5287_01620 [bacterium]|nr:hypothetical protein [bacterium]